MLHDVIISGSALFVILSVSFRRIPALKISNCSFIRTISVTRLNVRSFRIFTFFLYCFDDDGRECVSVDSDIKVVIPF